MTYRQYTKCYKYSSKLGNKPFNESSLLASAAGFVLFSGFTGGVIGLLAAAAGAGPIGVAALVAAVVALLTVVTSIPYFADQYLNHRLVCLDGDKCAIGTLRENPERNDLGKFDNDQFFDITLMPHRLGDDYVDKSTNYKKYKPHESNKAHDLAIGIVAPSEQAALKDHPDNDLYTDFFQGYELMRPTIKDLPYDSTRSGLHCEAEGDFWRRLWDLTPALAVIAAALGAGTAATAAAAATAGCAIGAAFFGVGCLIGAIIGWLLAALAAAISAYIIYKILASINDGSGKGEIQDANVGDASFGPIVNGDRVVVYGTHVYDGFHKGWHEIHPLKAVIKAAALHGPGRVDETPYYLEWDPYFPANKAVPKDSPAMLSSPQSKDITKLSPKDMRQGLNSDKFRARAEWIRHRWCTLLHDAFDPAIASKQQPLSQRWTIHPSVDGCTSSKKPPPVIC